MSRLLYPCSRRIGSSRVELRVEGSLVELSLGRGCPCANALLPRPSATTVFSRRFLRSGRATNTSDDAIQANDDDERTAMITKNAQTHCGGCRMGCMAIRWAVVIVVPVSCYHLLSFILWLDSDYAILNSRSAFTGGFLFRRIPLVGRWTDIEDNGRMPGAILKISVLELRMFINVWVLRISRLFVSPNDITQRLRTCTPNFLSKYFTGVGSAEEYTSRRK